MCIMHVDYLNIFIYNLCYKNTIRVIFFIVFPTSYYKNDIFKFVLEFLEKELEDYVVKLSVPTRIIRSPKRIGLIKARLMGARQAKGKILVFLDAHCECTAGRDIDLLDLVLHRLNVCPFSLQDGSRVWSAEWPETESA